MTRRPTRAQLADWYRAELLCERATAETVPCPGCGAPVDQTCVNVATGRPLQGPPAHWQRIALAAAQARLPPSSTPVTRSSAA